MQNGLSHKMGHKQTEKTQFDALWAGRNNCPAQINVYEGYAVYLVGFEGYYSICVAFIMPNTQFEPLLSENEQIEAAYRCVVLPLYSPDLNICGEMLPNDGGLTKLMRLNNPNTNPINFEPPKTWTTKRNED